MTRSRSWTVLVAGCVLLLAAHLGATTVVQMNLGDLCDRADRIFRGKVIDITPGTVSAGGAELPTVTYRVAVEQGFKGSFDDKNGHAVVEIRMFGSLKADPAQGGVQKLVSVPGVPNLRRGEEYVLFTTQPSAAGLSTFVGLGQGAFSLFMADKQEMVVNQVNNSGLIPGYEGGPILYSQLVTELQAELAN
jgi:hypothetical protein